MGTGAASQLTPGTAVEEAEVLMMRFAARTGLTSGAKPRRYLWTDAFAVCNFLALERATADARYRELALRLVDQVHHVLGRHRADDERTGWLSGLDEREGELHPTRGGLRIGKMLPERGAREAFDERLEWDRDGRYFHYLTKWMHALDEVSRATNEPRFSLWARELAEASHVAFTRRSARAAFGLPDGPRMAWKMSIDLSRPLVPSMGHHDPLDGLVSCLELRATAARQGSASAGPNLEAALADFAEMVEGGDWVTDDPLGLGGLLTDASRVARLMAAGTLESGELLETLLGAALSGLSRYAQGSELQRPASRRLAFRELGLAIGLVAVGNPELSLCAERSGHLAELLDALRRHLPLGPAIVSFWLSREHRAAASWTAHRDINEVMLATALCPLGSEARAS